MIDRDDPFPLYHQLKQILLGMIQDGRFGLEQAIPSEAVLQEQYGVSRITVRRALGELTNEGYLVRKPGKGTYVTHKKKLDHSGKLGGFTADLSSRNMKVETRILQYIEILAPQHIAQKMSVNPGHPLIMYQRLIKADGEPIALSTCFLDLPEKFVVTREELDKESLFIILERKYFKIFNKAERTVEAIMLMPEAAQLLETKPFTPALLNILLVFDENNRPVLFAQTTYRGDRYKHRCQVVS